MRLSPLCVSIVAIVVAFSGAFVSPSSGQTRRAARAVEEAQADVAETARETEPYSPREVESTVPRVRKLYSARHLPATDLAKSMSLLFSNARNELFIAPVPTTNQLLINGEAAHVEELLKMLALVDRQPKTVAIDIWILELNPPPAGESEINFADTITRLKPQLQELERAGRLTVANHIQLSGIENQKLMFQQGENRRVITGSQSVNGSPFRSNSLTSMNVGTIATGTARVTDENEIVADLSIEKSYSGRVEDGAIISTNSKGEDIRSPNSHTTVCQTTVSLHNGQIVTLGGLASSGKENIRILAAASLVGE